MRGNAKEDVKEWRAGELVTPSLRLVRELGRGGMGAVWVAEHLTLGSKVAVKFLGDGAMASKEAIRRFSIEAAAAALIRSPHVVQVFDHGVVVNHADGDGNHAVKGQGAPYIVMELLEGEDLAAYLDRKKRLDATETLSIVKQVCKALDHAHERGVIHRDVKPANIFLSPNGADAEMLVKVLDFGLAKSITGGEVQSMTATHAMFGTPHYVSPEQAENPREVTAQSDLWSVAVMIYECLTGRVPFDAHSLMGLCVALHEGRFPPASELLLNLSPAIDRFFERAFQPEPQKRFGSARELAEALEAVLAAPLAIDALPSSLTGTALPTDGVAAQTPWSSRAFLVLAVLIVGIYFLGPQHRPANAMRDSVPEPTPRSSSGVVIAAVPVAIPSTTEALPTPMDVVPVVVATTTTMTTTTATIAPTTPTVVVDKRLGSSPATSLVPSKSSSSTSPTHHSLASSAAPAAKKPHELFADPKN